MGSQELIPPQEKKIKEMKSEKPTAYQGNLG